MAPIAAPVDHSASLRSVRVRLDDDPTEMQRRLEAFLLIARRVCPAEASLSY